MPSTYVILRLFTSPCRPLYRRATTPSLYSFTAGMSMPSKVRPDAELLALPGRVGHLGRVQEGLGGDAAPVQAGAAELALLDQYDLQAELGGPQRAGVAAAASAEDDDVVHGAGVVRHGALLVREQGRSGSCGPVCRPHPVTAGTPAGKWVGDEPTELRDRALPLLSETVGEGVEGSVRLFRKRSKVGVVRQADSADTTHLTAFAQSHTGVEAFVEPPTTVSDHDGRVRGQHRGVDSAPGPGRADRPRAGEPTRSALLRRRPGRLPAADARLECARQGGRPRPRRPTPPATPPPEAPRLRQFPAGLTRPHA